MCIAGERGESCLGNGDGRELEKVGGGKNDPSFSFFSFEKIVSFLKGGREEDASGCEEGIKKNRIEKGTIERRGRKVTIDFRDFFALRIEKFELKVVGDYHSILCSSSSSSSRKREREKKKLVAHTRAHTCAPNIVKYNAASLGESIVTKYAEQPSWKVASFSLQLPSPWYFLRATRINQLSCSSTE